MFVKSRAVAKKRPSASVPLESQSSSTSRPEVHNVRSGGEVVPVQPAKFIGILACKTEAETVIDLAADEGQQGDLPGGEASSSCGEHPCTADDLAKWLQRSHGRFPQRKSQEELKKGGEACKEEHRLFLYVRAQKKAFASGKYDAKSATSLETLSGVQYKTQKDAWESKRSALQAWLSRDDASRTIVYPSQKSNVTEERKLANWVHEQRKQYREGTLSTEREQLLYDLSEWRWADHEEPCFEQYKRLQAWLGDAEDKYEKVTTLIGRNGKLRKEENAVCKFILQQRDGYRRRNRRSLSRTQKNMLDALDPDCNFPWPNGADISWTEYYQALERWGGLYEGLPIATQDECDEGYPDFYHEVYDSVHGWIGLGHFFHWSWRAIKDDRAGRPAEGRQRHAFHPPTLDGQQKKLIEEWTAGRAGEPRKKRQRLTCRKGAPHVQSGGNEEHTK